VALNGRGQPLDLEECHGSEIHQQDRQQDLRSTVHPDGGGLSSTGALAAARLLLPAQPVTVERANETTMDLEQIIDELVYRKRTASDAERQLINLTVETYL
jgi:hypothetical protein